MNPENTNNNNEVYLKSITFETAVSLCNYVNEKKIAADQIVSITKWHDMFCLFFFK